MITEKKLYNVILCLSDTWNNEIAILEENLKKDGLSCIYTEDGSCSQINADTAILITDHVSQVKAASKNGFVCIVVQSNSDAFIDGAVLVCGSLESLDSQTLEEVFLHTKGWPVTIARTERLMIREIAREDIADLCNISRQDGMEYLMCDGSIADSFFNEESLLAYIDHAYRFYGYGLWSVVTKDGELIGCCGIQDYDERVLELQYMVARQYQRQGYGTEMCRAVLNYAYSHTEAEQVMIRCHIENRPAQALARKLGFTLNHEKYTLNIRKEMYKGAERPGWSVSVNNM